MSLKDNVKGTFKFLFASIKEDWQQMDHKLIRIISGVVGFLIAALFWFYFFRNIVPTPF